MPSFKLRSIMPARVCERDLHLLSSNLLFFKSMQCVAFLWLAKTAGFAGFLLILG